MGRGIKNIDIVVMTARQRLSLEFIAKTLETMPEDPIK